METFACLSASLLPFRLPLRMSYGRPIGSFHDPNFRSFVSCEISLVYDATVSISMDSEMCRQDQRRMATNKIPRRTSDRGHACIKRTEFCWQLIAKGRPDVQLAERAQVEEKWLPVGQCLTKLREISPSVLPDPE